MDKVRAISFLGIRKLRVWTKFNFVNFELFSKKIPIFVFPCCSTLETLSIDVSITNVGLMGLGHFGRGHLGRGHYGRGHLGLGHYGRGHFGRGHLGRGHFGPLI